MNANMDYGWLGQHGRPLEHELGIQTVVEMGARVYNPILGRFLQVDPVMGGTSDDYTYVDDPINHSDLSGTVCWPCMVRKVSSGFRSAQLAVVRVQAFVAYGTYYAGYRMNKAAAKAGILGYPFRPVGWAMQAAGMAGDVYIDQKKQRMGIPETLLDEHSKGNINPFHGASRDHIGRTFLPGLYNKDTLEGRASRGWRSIRLDWAW